MIKCLILFLMSRGYQVMAEDTRPKRGRPRGSKNHKKLSNSDSIDQLKETVQKADLSNFTERDEKLNDCMPWETVYNREKHPKTLFESLKRGKSESQCAKNCNITVSRLKSWLRDGDKPEFRQAYDAGIEYYRAFWEDLLYKVVVEGQDCSTVQANLLTTVLKTQLGNSWTDKKDERLTEFDILSESQLDQEIEILERELKEDFT